MTIHLITTPAIPAIHTRCGALTLIGHAEGTPACVDPQPLTPAGHAAAILAGRWIWTLTRTGLVHLDSDRIKSRTRDGPILADHQCGQPMPPQFHAAAEQPETETDPEGIPY